MLASGHIQTATRRKRRALNVICASAAARRYRILYVHTRAGFAFPKLTIFGSTAVVHEPTEVGHPHPARINGAVI